MAFLGEKHRIPLDLKHSRYELYNYFLDVTLATGCLVASNDMEFTFSPSSE